MGMRLYLSILRNSLPPVKTVWPLQESQQNCTIGQLLESINGTFPLEAQHWGLEDYIVTLSGYELVHHHELSRVCKDEDQLTVRPLQTTEVRARTVSGRHQISNGGRHLIDGVAFGRASIIGPARPEIRIPPRKRIKLSEDEEEEVQPAEMLIEDNGDLQLEPVRLASGVEIDDEDDESDSDFENVDSVEELLNTDTEEDEDYGAADSDMDESEDSDSSGDEDASSDSSGDLESDTSGLHDSDSSSDGSTGSDSSSDSDSDSSVSWHGLSTSALKTDQVDERASQASSSKQAVSGAISHASDTLRKSTTTLESHDQVSADQIDHPQGIPHAGKLSTRHRNARRKRRRRLDYLKSTGILPPQASYTDLERYETEQAALLLDSNVEEPQISPETIEGNHVKEGQQLNDRSALVNKEHSTDTTEVVELSFSSKQQHNNQELMARQRKLKQAIMSGGVDINDELFVASTVLRTDQGDEQQDEAPEVLSSKEILVSTDRGDPATAATGPPQSSVPIAESAEATAPPLARRKLDLGSTNRLVFGSLGLRAPKNHEDRDKLRNKLSGQQEALYAAKPTETQEAGVETQGAADLEDWQSKINLSAVECLDPDVVLTAPSFPFAQRWDPQYRTSKKRKRKQAQQTYPDSYDQYNGDGLEYDDVPEREADPVEDRANDEDGDEYWEEGALLNQQYEEDDEQAEASGEATDPFPPLPEDVTTLPVLTIYSVQKGDYVTYLELVCSASTNWTPEWHNHTLQVLDGDYGQEGWLIKFAARNQPPKEYGEDGQRVYAKFEMQAYSDDEEDDKSETIIAWSSLTEPRLLLRPQSSD